VGVTVLIEVANFRLLFRYSNARGVIVPGNSDASTSQMTEARIFEIKLMNRVL